MEECKNVTVGNYQSVIGANMRAQRKKLGLTLTEAADRYTELTGVILSPLSFGAWERGDKNPSAAQLHFIALSLNCSEQALYGVPDHYLDIAHYMSEVAALPDYEQKVLIYAATKWSGNRHALVQFIQLYMSLDRKTRADVAGMGVMLYRRARDNGELLPEAPPLDIDYIEDEWERLMKQ